MATSSSVKRIPHDPEGLPLLWARPERLLGGGVFTELAFLVPREQLLLYALVLALAPRRCLEVGVFQGGATRMIHAALADLGRGCVVGLDPSPDIKIDWKAIENRASLIEGRSPQDLERAAALAGGPFDFVFLDGDHAEAAVLEDLEGLVRVTEPGAILILHDAYYAEVHRALVAARERGLPYVTGPILAATANPVTESAQGLDPETGELAVWGGMRLVWRVAAGQGAADTLDGGEARTGTPALPVEST